MANINISTKSVKVKHSKSSATLSTNVIRRQDLLGMTNKLFKLPLLRTEHSVSVNGLFTSITVRDSKVVWRIRVDECFCEKFASQFWVVTDIAFKNRSRQKA